MKWPLTRFENIIAETRNGLYKHGDFYGRGTRILKMFNLLDGGLNLERIDQVELDADEAKAFALERGDILMNRVNTPELVGKCAVIPDGFGVAVFESKNIRIRVRRELAEPAFIARYLSSPTGRPSLTQGMKHAIGMATLNGTDLRSCMVPVPPLTEQQRIVELLEQADALRRQRAEADTLAARILPALFRKMFGDPTRNISGWPTENLLKICSPRQWPTISSRELLESGFPVYGANGRIGFYDSFNHEKPTVLITCRGATCGTINVCESKSYVTGNAMSLDEPDESKTTNEFLEWFLRVRGLCDTITGAAQPQITRANLAVVEVPTPPPALVEAFTDKARAVRRIEAEQTASRTNIETLFQTMLHRAFTGELTARWREAHLKELLADMEQQARHLRGQPA